MQYRIKPGYGYWDITHYPLGGKFCRAPKDTGVELVSVEKMPEPCRGCDTVGVTTDGRRVASRAAHIEQG